MRLLNAATHALEEFVDDDHVPPYTILSHTWGAEEVTFKDLSSALTSPPVDWRAYKNKQGWPEIVNSAQHARNCGWRYIWIDTCCIDKSDVTDLSEAINSMFRWYECAEVCYAYLANVPPDHPTLVHPWTWSFRSSRWFRRGWTLQELLAPSFLEFLDRDWNPIGSRTNGPMKLSWRRASSVATKLSWAANRETTLVGDRTYSLLGLLGVNMPLIYGEGERAFTRLQHELIRSSSDESIFAWGSPMSECSRNIAHGVDSPILAPSPRDYEHTRGIVTWMFDKRRKGFAMTNAGLSLNAELLRMDPRHADRHPL
ncbi:HET-domain-containing protein [Parachaetomium inaequale]|uniref:HET-domain-containing protein n=1 Tax=Parachaetomium inaequale TaxID=2588326 RepID=A0AAN6P6U3_9PEZI|nr:HET-domain-containing protein [Parachaetomium inaequale]